MNNQVTGNRTGSLHRQCSGSAKFSSDFLPESVTAKTISRLSQGVARLTADDAAVLTEPKFSFRRSNSVADYHTLPYYSTSFRKSKKSAACKYSADTFASSSSILQTCENSLQYVDKNRISSHTDTACRNCLMSKARTSSASFHSPVMNPFSPSCPFFNPSPVDIKDVPQDIPFGSKRTFRQATDYSREDDFSNSTKQKVLHAQETLRPPNSEIAPVRLPLEFRSRFSRKNNPSNNKDIVGIQNSCNPSPLPMSASSLFSKISHSCTRRYSSDASMLSITPSHSCSSVSSSPVLSSSSDSESKSHRVKESRPKSMSVELQGRCRSRLKNSCNRASDSWHWRSSNMVTIRESSLHPRNHRPHIASSNGDDSSDGPMCRLKRARINFVITSPEKSCESTLESEPSEKGTRNYNASKPPFSRRSQHQRKRSCSPSSLRRSNSLSPSRCMSGRRQRPMKFRLSFLRSFESDEMATFSIVHGTQSNCSLALSTQCKSHVRSCQDEDEGDDECSDTSQNKPSVLRSQ